MFIGFALFSKNLVSVDSLAHIYEWEYTKEYFKPSLSFQPAHKSRILVDSAQYVKDKKETRYMFPTGAQGGKLDINVNKLSREERTAAREYMENNINIDLIIGSALVVQPQKDATKVSEIVCVFYVCF